VRPFTVRFAEEALDDLRTRLLATRWPETFDDEKWTYGTNGAYLRELCEYWSDGFDWRAVETRLGAFENSVTRTSAGTRELDIQFLHARSQHANAFPLLLIHGWPGSILEFEQILPLLVAPESHGGEAADAFHVVCPSIPGFGFSEIPKEPGTNPEVVADLFADLMRQLGYDRYGAQGGDYGSVISTLLGARDPAHCAAIHLNLILAGPPKDSDPMAGLSPAEVEHLNRTASNAQTETGYYAIQSTKPQSLGYGLHDSPAGLAAWIIEKFHAWSDCNGDIEQRFSKDQLLANITLYWLTGTITSSCRMYAEQARMGRTVPGPVPTGAALFPGEMIKAPRAWAERRYPNLVRWTEMESGGHFAAMEEPQLLAREIRAFFRSYR